MYMNILEICYYETLFKREWFRRTHVCFLSFFFSSFHPSFLPFFLPNCSVSHGFGPVSDNVPVFPMVLVEMIQLVL